MAKILIIDDDAGTRKFVARVAAVLGYSLIEASNGLEGLSAAVREMPDLIVCDILMPTMDGLETVKLIRKEKALRDTPIVMITIVSEHETIMKFLNMGISYYFVKPVDFSKFKNKVRQIMDVEQNRRKKEQSIESIEKRVERSGGKPLLVICEPNESLMKRFASMLDENYEIINVTDGASCLNAIFNEYPNAVIMEYESAFLTSVEIAARIRSIPSVESTKILVIYSPKDKDDVSKYSDWFDMIIEKPFSTNTVVNAVSSVLERDQYEILSREDGILIRFRPGSLKWSVDNYDQAFSTISQLLLEMFESGKTVLTLDTTKAGEDEEKYIHFVEDLIEKASDQDLKVRVATNSSRLTSEIKIGKGDNVSLVKSSFSVT